MGVKKNGYKGETENKPKRKRGRVEESPGKTCSSQPGQQISNGGACQQRKPRTQGQPEHGQPNRAGAFTLYAIMSTRTADPAADQAAEAPAPGQVSSWKLNF